MCEICHSKPFAAAIKTRSQAYLVSLRSCLQFVLICILGNQVISRQPRPLDVSEAPQAPHKQIWGKNLLCDLHFSSGLNLISKYILGAKNPTKNRCID